jgi:hypothetical protein
MTKRDQWRDLSLINTVCFVLCTRNSACLLQALPDLDLKNKKIFSANPRHTCATKEMSKLELLKDMSDKICSMLKPKARPACVLLFENDRDPLIMFKTDTLSKEDHDLIM